MQTAHPTPFPTLFVGRQNDLAYITQRLADPACRLLTLLGPGGIGKTRLAWEVTRHQENLFADGAAFIVLQPLSDSHLIVPSIAEAIYLQFSPTDDQKQQLLYHLHSKSMLLVLDNFEHLLDGVEIVSEILAHAPHIKILTTSRERLNLVEEWVLTVEGLSVPPSSLDSKIDDYEAVQLFIHSAERVQAGFRLTDAQKEAVTRICQLVGGMPLGIEMAAAWVRSLSCEEIATEIEHSMDILATPARNVPPRHRNMRAALEHSWKLLPAIEQNVFKRLSVFRGGFTREAAESVADASVWTLTALVDKSLLRIDSAGRYHLQELLRQYAEEQLEASHETIDAQERHAAYFAAFLQQRWEALKSYQQRHAVDDIDTEIENIRTAWHTMCQRRKATDLQKAAKSLWLAYDLRCRFPEMVALFHKGVEALQSSSGSPEIDNVIGLLLALEGWAHVGSGQPEKGQRLVKAGLALLEETGTGPIEDILVGYLALQLTTHYLNRTLSFLRVSKKAIEMAQKHNHAWALARALYDRTNFVIGYTERPGFSALKRQRIAQETKHVGEECLALAESCGDIWLRASITGFLLGNVNRILGNYFEAKWRYEQGLRLFEEIDQSWAIGAVHRILGVNGHYMKDYPTAWKHHLTSLKVYTANSQVHEQLADILFMAEMMIDQAYLESAAELLALARHHPASLNSTRAASDDMLDIVQSKLSPETYKAAVEKGQHARLETVVAQLLASEDAPMETINQSQQIAGDRLTERELEILKLMSQGLTNREIAQSLFLSVGTVKWYSSQILGKLNAQNRVQALTQARALNLL